MCQSRYVILLAVWCITTSSSDVVRNEDICGPHNGRRLYLELGEQGILRADNVTLIKNSPRQDIQRPYTTNSSHDQCSLELVTCPSCVITLTFKSIDLLHHCGDGGITIDSPCRCDYVWLSEPPYEDVSGTPFCGHYAPIVYRSNTRTLSITLLYSQSHKHAFTIEYTAERNRLLLKGSTAMNEMSKFMNNTGGGSLTSPFFPARYPRDLGMEYIITCPTEVTTCRVRVLFSDFQLAAVSIMEFYDWNGQRLDVSSGARFRPPIIVSTGPSLLIRFYANGGTGLGYKAFYSFIFDQFYDKHTHPITDCGGYVENLGGAITMMDMVGDGIKTYDCVWLIRPPKNFLHMKTHMYLKVITFAEMAGNTELIIKQGPTSALMPLEVLRHPASQLQPPRLKEHITPVTSGFHVSLRGSFGTNSRLAIAYAAFSYMDCFTGTDFLCQNHRCIPSQLNCDGFDNCGDNSDEPSSCLHDWDLGMQDRKWQQNKANYYFPKIDRYPDLKTATLVFVASSLGLIVLISALIILLYRVGARARQQRELQSRLRTISELLVINLADGARIDEISVTDDPPVYEAPPNYDEVIKVGMEDEENSTRRKKRRSLRESGRSRSITSSQCSCDYEAQMTLNIYEDPSSANRSSQTTPIPSSTAELTLPESPPPPYITPPNTVRRNYDCRIINDLPGPSGTNSNTVNENASTSDIPNPGTGLARVRPCNLDCREHARRTWLRNSTSHSRSLPASRTGSASTSPSGERNISSTSSVDAETMLGAYHREGEPSISTDLVRSQASAPSDSRGAQSSNSSDASVSTNIAYVGTKPEVADELPAVVPHVVLPQPEDPDPEEEDDPERDELRPIIVCSCEGACNCANSAFFTHDEISRTTDPRRSSIDESPSTRRKIIRLLAGSRSASRSSVAGAISVDSGITCLSNCSTPCNASLATHRIHQRQLPRKLSICSRDSRTTKVSTVSACSSYEKLQDEFDVVSETTSILGPGTSINTPRNTPSRFMELSLPAPRQLSNRDLNNLYESIKALDTFLAQRNIEQNPPAMRTDRPVTVMVFGSPKHRLQTRSDDQPSTITQEDSRDNVARIRVWRSDDAFANQLK